MNLNGFRWGLILSAVFSASIALAAPTLVTCDASAVTIADSTPRAITLTGHCDHENFLRENTLTGVTFPRAGGLTWTFADLPTDAHCYFRVPDEVVSGQTFQGANLFVAATTEPTPTPTPTPDPTPTPTPLPPTQIPACGVQSGTDAAGDVWSIQFGDLLRNGAYAMPARGFEPGAKSDYLVFVAGVMVSHDPRDGKFYKWVAPNMVLAPAPTCDTSTPTPTPTPTPTVNLQPVIDAIAAQTAEQARQTQELLTAIGALKPPTPVEPEVCKTAPLRMLSISWPSSPIGSRTGRWDSGAFTLVEAGFKWLPSLRFEAKDTRGCSVTVVR